MVEQQTQQEKNPNKGLFSGWLPKILLLIAVALVVSVVIFGIEFTPMGIISTILKVIVAVVLMVLVAKGIQSLIAKAEFSPTRRWKEKLTRVAELSKPFNIKNLYIRGEDMRVYSKWGKIIGLVFVPYISAKPKTDANGNYIYVPKRDKRGNIIKDKDTEKAIMVHDYEYLTEQDGDWVFIIRRGFWIFGTKEMVRSHKKYVSDIGETTWIKTPNLLPIGDYFYPCQQWLADIERIQMQHQAEALIETYQEFLDLVANITTMTLRADPHFRKMQEANIETIQQDEKRV